MTGKVKKEFVEKATKAIEAYVGEQLHEPNFRDREEDGSGEEPTADWVANMLAEHGRKYGMSCLEEYFMTFGFWDDFVFEWVNDNSAFEDNYGRKLYW